MTKQERVRKTKRGTVRKKLSREDTASRLLSVATRLFAARGYDRTSTKEICKTAGANIAAIHYHFGSKEELYYRIIEQFATEQLDFARETLQPAENIDDFKIRLEIFLRQTLETMLRQRDILRLIPQDADMSDARGKRMYFDTILKHAAKLQEFFNDARKKGIVPADREPFFAAGLLMSNIFFQTRNDEIVKKLSGFSLLDDKYRNDWILQTCRIFEFGILAK